MPEKKKHCLKEQGKRMGYDLIYSDPPWPQQKGNVRKSRPNQGRRLDYPTMSVEDCFKMQDPFFGQAHESRREFFGKYTTVMREPATYHSRKPVCAYEMLEDMFPDTNKIELFARNIRPGWLVWGNEIEEGFSSGEAR